MWIDLTCWPQANNGTSDLIAYPGQRTRIVPWPQANNGTSDLIAYQVDLRPLGSRPEVPHYFTVAFVEVDVLGITLGGHTPISGGTGAYWLRYSRMTHRRPQPHPKRRRT